MDPPGPYVFSQGRPRWRVPRLDGRPGTRARPGAMSGWDSAEPLEDWLARRLAEEYPSLTDRHTYHPHALPRLVRSGYLLPVLDGLDELPHQRRAAAIDAFNTVLAGRPVVVTCRREAYTQAVAATGTLLDGAAVVELAPITATAAAGYLPAGQIDGPRR